MSQFIHNPTTQSVILNDLNGIPEPRIFYSCDRNLNIEAFFTDANGCHGSTCISIAPWYMVTFIMEKDFMTVITQNKDVFGNT